MPPIASDTGTLSSQYRSSGPSSGLIRKNNELFNLMLTRGGADSVSLSPFFPPVSARAARVTRNLPPCLLSFIYFFYWFGRFDSLSAGLRATGETVFVVRKASWSKRDILYIYNRRIEENKFYV